MKALKIITGTAIAAASIAAPMANADHGIDSRWYVAPMARYVITDDERALVNEEGHGLELNFGRQVSDLLNVEVNVFGDKIEQDATNTDLNQFGAGANFLIVPKRTGFAPYALLGAGALWTQGDANPGNTRGGHPNPYGEIGLGAFIPVSAHGTKLRLEAKHRASRNNDTVPNEHTFQDTIVSLGLQVPFGAAKAAAVAAPVVAVLPLTPADSDNDGVANGADLCPATPAGVPVAANGCALDTDNDGIVNAADLCPNTANGIRVDNNGCELAPVINLDGVGFALNSANLLPSATATLDDAIVTLRRYPETRVLVAGHTDSQGDAGYNQKLSQARADSVRTYLTNGGVNANQLTTRGFGESEPVASNVNRAGRAQNRRVELRILN